MTEISVTTVFDNGVRRKVQVEHNDAGWKVCFRVDGDENNYLVGNKLQPSKGGEYLYSEQIADAMEHVKKLSWVKGVELYE